MIPVVDVATMRAMDERARSFVSEKTLIHRAGFSVYSCLKKRGLIKPGMKVAVVFGKGNNGRDALVAAAYLERAGAGIERIPYAPGIAIPPVDLVLDGAFGTGFRGSFQVPKVNGSPRVVAVDIPSGLDGDTGEIRGEVLVAEITVTFAAMKPGLLLNYGPRVCGEVVLADIGLDTSDARDFLVERKDVARAWRPKDRLSHKWTRAIGVIGGSSGMVGAAVLAAEGAKAAGATMVRLAIPGASPWDLPVSDHVSVALPQHFSENLLNSLGNIKAAVIGPGLGRAETTVSEARAAISSLSHLPLVVDADGLYALANWPELASIFAKRELPAVLTPHRAEFERIFGPLGDSALDALRRAARELKAVVLLKGPTTLVCSPEGRIAYVASKSPALATSGTGDVLSGMIGALLAAGSDPFEAAYVSACLHQEAAAGAHPDTFRAAELLPRIALAIGTWVNPI